MRPPGILMGLPSPGLRMILLQEQAVVQVINCKVAFIPKECVFKYLKLVL